MRVSSMMLGAVLITACNASPQWPERTLRVSVQAPNPCWSIGIESVYRHEGELLVVSRLHAPEPGQMCAQVISTVSHRVTLPLPDDPVTYLVLGRQWSWGDLPPGYELLPDREALAQRLEGAELLHRVGPGEGERDSHGAVE